MKRIILLIISFILFGVSSYYAVREYKKTKNMYDNINDSVQKQVNKSINEGKKQIELNIAEISESLKIIGNTIKKNGVTSTNISGFLTFSKTEKLKISGLGVIVVKQDKTQKILYSGIQKKTGIKLEFVQIPNAPAAFPWFEKILNIKESIIETYYDQTIKSYSYAIISKIDGVKFNSEKDAQIFIFGIISTADIKAVLEDLDFGKRGYPFITNAEGNIILHPLEKNLFINFKDIVKGRYTAENNEKVLRCFNEKIDTYIDEKDFSNFSNRKIIAISYSPQLKSFIGAIFNKTEIGFPFSELKLQLMKDSLTTVMAIFFVCIFFAALKKDAEKRGRRIKILAAAAAVAFSFGLGFLWYLERFYGMDNPGLAKAYISDRASLKKFIQSEKNLIKENKSSEKKYIPTGILVQSIKILGLNEAQVSGVVWQKISPSQKGKVKEGIQFPDAITVKIEEAYRTNDINNNEIIGWTFMAVLRQQFENKLYPFEKLKLKVLITQKNFLEKIQIIPDFDSYEEYSSSSNSFLSPDVIVPEWIVKQTYLTIAEKDYMTTFGYSKNELKNSSRDLLLNITLQRDFLSNFFSTFLPFFVLLLLAYIGLLFSSNDEAKSKIFSFKASNMQGITSGFLLFLVFSIAAIRKQAFSSELLYIEYLYFFTIFVLLILVLSVVHIYGSKKTILGYKDGFYVKNLYWPLVIGAMFLITYFNFKG